MHAGIQPPTGTRNPGTRHPLRDQAPPWDQIPHGADPPGPGTPWSRHPSPGPGAPPCTVHAGRYGQQAGGMHPTGMQSCLKSVYTKGKRM